jgi:hypothetical protein
MAANRFWPYDLSLPADVPSPRSSLSWEQHARMADFVREAARTAAQPVTFDDQGVPAMQATVFAALADDELMSLMSLLDDSEVVLGAFTDEELATVDPPGDEPLVPLPLIDLVPEGQARDQLLAASLRSLLARGLLAMGAEPGELIATGALSTVLAIRGRPNLVLIVEHVEEDDPTRVVVYGFVVKTERGLELLLMEESVTVLGHHEFVLRSVGGQAAALTEWLGAGMESPSGNNGHAPVGPAGRAQLDGALDNLRALTRLHVLRRDDDGTGEAEFSELELTLADGGEHGRFMALFQTADDDTEGMLVVPAERLDLEVFFAALLRLDLTPFNEALAAS